MSAPICGSFAELVGRAAGSPVFITAPRRLNRRWLDKIVADWRRHYPHHGFAASWELYPATQPSWQVCRSSEREKYGAAIVITADAAVDPVAAVDAIGPIGEHFIGAGVAGELRDFDALCRPLLWCAVEIPTSHFIVRFAVEPLEWFSLSRYAQLCPASDCEPFHPAIGDLPLDFLGGPMPGMSPRKGAP